MGVVVAPASLVRNMVDSTGGQWVASQQTPDGQQRALDRTVHLHRGNGVGGTGGVVPARRRQRRRDEALIETHRSQKGSRQPSTHHSLITIPRGSPPRPLCLTLAAPGQEPIQILPQNAAVGTVGTRQSANDDTGTRLERTDPLRHQSSHTTLDPVAVRCQRDLLLGHNDADESRGIIPSPAGVVVNDQPAVPATRTSTDRGGEVLTPRQPMRRAEHLRRRDERDPCGVAKRGQRGLRGWTCAYGSRAPWHDDGCSAGRSACSRA